MFIQSFDEKPPLQRARTSTGDTFAATPRPQGTPRANGEEQKYFNFYSGKRIFRAGLTALISCALTLSRTPWAADTSCLRP